ncbi:restriction endonuclease subunit S [Aeromonas veronii]|uniref:restriction endonuclease subunit S n=1 Tax=Aeromonas veronii TaxID=654 RepID=UPI003BA0329C
MAINLTSMRLEDCMDAIIDYRGKTPTKTTSGIPLITAKIIKNGRIQDATEFIAEDDYASWMRRGIPQSGDVVLTTEAPLGEVAQLDASKIALAQRVITLRGKKGLLDNDFLLYLLQSHDVQHQLDGRGTGSTVKGIKQSELKEVILSFPPITAQKRIAKHLKDIDNKITLSQKISQTLEQMAQTLFKSWFVDFDPVIDNALDTGFFEQELDLPDELLRRAEARKAVRAREGFKPLPAATRQLFPAAFEPCTEPSLGLDGWVPKGWRFESFEQLLTMTIGGDWGKDSPDEAHSVQSRIVRGTDIPDLISGQLSKAPLRWVDPKKLKSRKLEVGDIVIEVSGGSPTQSTGRSIFMSELMLQRLGEIVEPASFCRRFKPKSVNHGLLGFLHLQKIYADGKMWEYQNQSTGIANFQTKFFIESEQVLLPTNNLLDEFCKLVKPLIDKSHSNEQIVLAKLRDTLLPKLISGELSLDDVELTTQQGVA